jgi:predicted P-loop ATPase
MTDPGTLPWADLAAYRAQHLARNPIPDVAAVPPDLAARQQWLVWKYEPGETPEKKPRKMPYYAGGSRRHATQGSDTDRAALTTYLAAATAANKRGFDGVGFAFLPGDGLIGIDLDGMIDPDTGEISQRCAEIIKACDSYTELSPSGKGVHIICAGETETFKSNKVGIEVFCGRQYFTFTARPWPGASGEIRPLGESALRRLRLTVKGKKTPAPAAAPPAPSMPSAQGGKQRSQAESVALAEEAMGHLDPSEYQQWIEVGMACKAGLGTAGYYVWDAWSATSEKYAGGEDTRRRWDGFKPDKLTLGTVFGLAESAGWVSPWAKARAKKARPRKPANALPGAVDASDLPSGLASTPSGAGASQGGPPEPPPDDGADGDYGPHGWRRMLLRKNGNLVDCRENVYLMLKHHPDWKGVLWADEFAKKIVMRKAPPWRSADGFETNAVWDGDDALRLGLWLAQRERMIVKNVQNLTLAVGWSANENRCHPVREYLDGLTWDGTPRIDKWLTDYMGVKESDYTRLVGRLYLIGLVARIFRPGCQMRFMPIFEGRQYRGKSSAFRVLGGKWYGDSTLNLHNKDSYQLIQGVWVYEIAELDSFSRADSTMVKAFISSQVDRFRAPYAAAPEDHPRSVGFGGSTNEGEYFKDETGNTRYWPLRCEEIDSINIDGLAGVRDQLFAEAVEAFRAGERWHPSAEEQQLLFEPEQAEREVVDPWFERVAVFLGDVTLTRITALELLTDCLKIEVGKIGRAKAESMAISKIMRRLGWKKERETSGNRLWYYERPKEDDSTSSASAAGSSVEVPGVPF